MNIDDQAKAEEEQKPQQSVQDTQMSSASPPQLISVSIETVTVKDVSDLTTQNINPLIEEDLKKILDQSTLQTKLCDNPVLISVDEIKKSESMTAGEEVKTQETITITPQVTSVQPSPPLVVYQRKEIESGTVSTPMDSTSVSVNIQETEKDTDETVGEDKVETPVNDGSTSQIGQVDVPTPPAQVQGAIELKEAEKDKPKDIDLTPKPKELEAIQALVTLPVLGTPSSQTLQRPSTDATPLQFLVSSPSSSKAEEVITYGDVSLNEEIVLPKFDYAAITIEHDSSLK